MKTVIVKTNLRNYPVHIKPGLFGQAASLIKDYFKNSEKIAFVTNDKVYCIYEEKIKNLLSKSGYEYIIIIIPDGEQNKKLENVNLIYNRLIDFNFHRNDLVIAFGGGVIGDLAGYAASTFHRGARLIQFPTTLMSQVDSSIGGKVVVNFEKIKNVIGTFYQPHAVLIDPELIYSLEEKEIVNGLAEIVKYGIIFKKKILYDLENIPGQEKIKKDFFQLLCEKKFREIIYECCRIKAQIVSRDEFDTGIRNLLNFGHTFGHAIEKVSGLSEINHGMAVAIGMVMAIDASIIMGYVKEHMKQYIVELYRNLKLPYFLKGQSTMLAESLLGAMQYDKKFTSTKNKFILLKGINRPFFALNLSEDIIKEAIIKNIRSF